jgi:hypothetical protein
MLQAVLLMLARVNVEQGHTDACAWTSNKSDRDEAEGSITC